MPSTELDKTVLEPRRKQTGTSNILIDNYFTKSTECETMIKRKSREKSKEKIEKENKCINIPTSVVSSVHTDSKRGRINTMKNKINDSFNYGRAAINRSMEKQPVKR